VKLPSVNTHYAFLLQMRRAMCDNKIFILMAAPCPQVTCCIAEAYHCAFLTCLFHAVSKSGNPPLLPFEHLQACLM
jgi:hypothetical protein